MLVDGLPIFHRSSTLAADDAEVIVHVHGFGISGTYLEPTAALLAPRFRTFVPDLPGMGRSVRPAAPLDVPGLAAALLRYLDAVGVERATFVGNSLGCPIIVEVASAASDRITAPCSCRRPADRTTNRWRGRSARWRRTASGNRRRCCPSRHVTISASACPTACRCSRMTRYPTLERLPNMIMPTLIVVGSRDPLVRQDRIHVVSAIPHVQAVRMPGAHALNFGRAAPLAELIEAFVAGDALEAVAARHPGVEVLTID